MNFNLINPQERRFFLPLFDRGPFLFFSRPPPICTANARRRTVERQPPRRKPQECLPSPLRPSECANGILIRFSPTRLFHLSWLSNDIDKFYNFFRQFLILKRDHSFHRWFLLSVFYILFALLNAVIRFLEIVLLKKCYALKSESWKCCLNDSIFRRWSS